MGNENWARNMPPLGAEKSPPNSVALPGGDSLMVSIGKNVHIFMGIDH